MKEIKCENCGNIQSEDTRFCRECGSELVGGTVTLSKGIGARLIEIFLLILGYLVLPQIVGSIFYYQVKLSESLSLLIGDITFIICLVICYRKMFIQKIKDYFSNFSKYFPKGLKYWGLGLLIMMVSNFILSMIFEGNIAANEEANREFINNNLVIGFISVVLFAPIAEEMIFRYGVRLFSKSRKWFPLISAFVFGLPHALTGITTPLELLYIIPYGALGYFFAKAYMETDNILTSMIMHMTHNFMCIMVILLFV